MHLRLLLPPMFVSAIGVAAFVGMSTGSWSIGVLAGVVAGFLVGVSSAYVMIPLLSRIESLASTVKVAAHRSTGAGAVVAGEDELEMAGRTFNELSSQWSERIAELSDQANTLTAVLDGMAEGVWVTDANGTITQHNFALREMLSAAQPITGQRPLSLIRSTELNQAVVAACTRQESSRLEVLVEGIRPRILAVQVIPLGRNLEGSAAVFHDLTELRRLEKVRKDFVANVSHELRTPITAIRGYAETLRSGALADPEHAPRMVEIIHRQSERLSSLVSDLLELSRLESGELKLERVQVPLAEAAARAADAVRPRAEEKQLSLSIDVDPQLAAVGDPRALEQVLINLLDNAVKYTPQRGQVRVSGQRVDGRAVLTVKDTGIGIDEKHLARIFERFYRVDKGRSRDTGGTGLGLAIVKHLVGAMKGEVRVASRPGEGSAFTLLLPEAPPRGQAETA